MAKGSNKNNETRWWRQINQTPTKALSPEAKVRQRKFVIKTLTYSVAIILLMTILSAAVFLVNKHVLPVCLSPFSKEIENIDFESDGVLKKSHLITILKDYNGKVLMGIDIYELKEKLETIEQIKNAEIERKFPSTLIIKIKEHIPIFKIIVPNEKGKNQGYLVSDEGIIYKGYGYDPTTLKDLLYLKGVNLRKTDDGKFSRLGEIAGVRELIKLSKTSMPHLYKNWASISMEYMQFGPEAIGAFVKIITKTGMSIIFSPKGYMFQLERLDSLLTYVSQQKLDTIERIDLSINGQVAVKIARN